MQVLREFADWDRQLYALGIDLTESPASKVVEYLERIMRGYNDDWSYDEKLGIDWIIEWAYTPDSSNFEQIRHGCTFDLEDAGALYDFLVFMNEHGWED
jgi:hypothetical protein